MKTTLLVRLAALSAVALGATRAAAQDPATQAPPAAEPTPAPSAAPATSAAPTPVNPAPAAAPAPDPAPGAAAATTAAATTAAATTAAAPSTPAAGPVPPRANPQLAPWPGPETPPAPAQPAPVAATAPPTAAVDAAELPPAAPAPDTPSLDLWLGFHTLVIPSDGYDVFSDDDGLTSFAIGAGAGLADLGAVQLAAVATLSTGGSEATVRGQSTELSVLRLSVGPELRWPLLSRLFVYGRVSPQLVRASASLKGSSSTSTFSEDEWLFGVDAALGVSARIGEIVPRGLGSPICFYVRGEAGYGWTPSSELELTAQGSSAPIRSAPLELGELSLAGASFRGALGVGY